MDLRYDVAAGAPSHGARRGLGAHFNWYTDRPLSAEEIVGRPLCSSELTMAARLERWHEIAGPGAVYTGR